MKYFPLLLLIFLSHSLIGQNLSAKDLLAKSIQYHDPGNKLATGDYEFIFEEKRPDGKTNKAIARFAPSQEIFEITRYREENATSYFIDQDSVEFSLNGDKNISEENLVKYRLDADRGMMLKNYYLYLWHLPMKLNDPGTILREEVVTTNFEKRSALEIKVTYEQSVGEDIWYFYFDPETYAMIGYRFYHDESIPDGEYIYINGEVEMDGIRIPAQRKWYTHKEDKFLGEDVLVEIRKVK